MVFTIIQVFAVAQGERTSTKISSRVPSREKGHGGGLHRENHSANHGNEEEVYSQGSIFNDRSSELIRARKPKRWNYGKEWRDGDVMLIHLMSAVKANNKILRSRCI